MSNGSNGIRVRQQNIAVSLHSSPVLRVSLSANILSQVQENLYELAKKDGFKGSLTEFLESLKVQGENGITFVPKIEKGVLSWTNDGNLPNPPDFVLEEPELENIIDHILNHG